MLVALLAGGAWAARPPAGSTVSRSDPPLVCHYESGDGSACEVVLSALAEAWAAQVDRLGFNAPVPDGAFGGGPELDVYLSHRGTGGAGGAYVTCDGDEAAACVDAVHGDGLASTPAYIVIDPDTPAADLAPYARHEFNHVLQYATDFEEPFLDLWEGVAVSAEAWTDPAAPVDPGPIADYQATPWASVVLQDGYELDEQYGLWSYYEYGATLWVRWLDERHGDGAGSIGPALWAATANDPGVNEPDVLDAWAAVRGDVAGDLVAFTRFRAGIGADAEPAWLQGLGGDVTLACQAHVEVDQEPAGVWTARHEVWPMGFVCATFAHGSTLVVEGAEPADFVLVDLDAAEDAPATDALRFDGPGVARVALLWVPSEDFDADDPLTAVFPALSWATEPQDGGCASGCATQRAAGSWVLALGAVAACVRRAYPSTSKAQASQTSGVTVRGTRKPSVHGAAA